MSAVKVSREFREQFELAMDNVRRQGEMEDRELADRELDVEDIRQNTRQCIAEGGERAEGRMSWVEETARFEAGLRALAAGIKSRVLAIEK